MKKLLTYLVFSLLFTFTNSLFSQKVFNDTLTKANEIAVFHVLGHSSAFVEYKDLKIYVDPYSTVYDFTEMPKADLIFITHENPDHFDINAIKAILKDETLVIYTQTCKNAGTYNGKDTTMANGDSATFKGVGFKAVAAYNIIKSKHKKGIGNGYILNFGNIRIYVSGDTEIVPEMSEIKNIDLAFLAYSQPYNMTTEMLTEVALEMKPNEIIPSHYDLNDPTPLIEALSNHPEIKILTGQTINTNIKRNTTQSKSFFNYDNRSKTIYFKENETNSQIVIYNLLGKAILKTSLNNTNINVSSLAKGVYIVSQQINQESKTGKFIKN